MTRNQFWQTAFRRMYLLVTCCLLAGLIGARPVLAEDANANDSDVTVLTGGTLIDVTSGETMADAVVIIRGERVEAVGPAGTLAMPANATIIPMEGRWLVPGLMNMHVHLGLKLPGAAGAALVDETDVEEVLRMAANARRSLESGVTTLRLIGEDHGTDFALKKAIDSGQITGPRIERTAVFTAIAIVSPSTITMGRVTSVKNSVKRSARPPSNAASCAPVTNAWALATALPNALRVQ